MEVGRSCTVFFAVRFRRTCSAVGLGLVARLVGSIDSSTGVCTCPRRTRPVRLIFALVAAETVLAIPNHRSFDHWVR